MTTPVEDPLAAALEEAESLMESLGTSNDVDFAIDSDDEKEFDLNEAEDQLHPLHEHFLISTETDSHNSLLSNDEIAGIDQASTVDSSDGKTQQDPSNNLSSMGGLTTTSGVAPSIDILKASTSRFASNLANMAQRAATQVQTAVSNPPTIATGAVFTHCQSPSQITQVQQTIFATQRQHDREPPQTIPEPELDMEAKHTLIQTHVGNLIPGERVIMFLTNVLYVSDSNGFQSSNQIWCCAMTYYRLILFATHPVKSPPKPESWNYACWPQQTKAILQIPLATIDRVEKSVFTVHGGGITTDCTNTSTPSNITTLTHTGVVVTSKLNGRQLRFSTANYQDIARAYNTLHNYAFPGRRNLGYLFAFESKREKVLASIEEDTATGQKTVMLEPCHRRFDPYSEFQRQFTNAGLKSSQSPWSIWGITNATYQLCLSYPSTIVGPSSLDESVHPDAARVVRQCAAFRSEHRLPVLTWCSVGGASIWRCSQPKIGLQGNRSSADELYLKHIAEGAASANAIVGRPAMLNSSVLTKLTGSTDLTNWMPNGVSLKILDLRPRSAAMANRTGGYGYENTSNYPGCSLQFCNIGNIHAVRDAYQKMSQICLSPQTSDLQFSAAIEDSKWLSLIRLIWSAAWETAYWIHVHRLPVVVHCSHGWDRTSQVAALAQLLLDPHYRTMKGFACLCEKEFMSFGHPSHTRCGHGEGKDGVGNNSSTSGAGGGTISDEGQISPILLQFLDCVFQIVNQYPECFEFNSRYILCISEHIYSCRFGNFLCDTEREREKIAGIRQRTHSLWDYVEERLDLVNTQYSPDIATGVMLMPLPTLLRNITLWTDRHCAFGAKATTRWLPFGVEEQRFRGDIKYDSDQLSDLETEYENRWLISSILSESTKKYEGN